MASSRCLLTLGSRQSYLSKSPPWQLPAQVRVSSRGSDAGRLEWTPKAKVLQPLGACLPPPGLSLQPGGCRAGGQAGLSTAPRGSSCATPHPQLPPCRQCEPLTLARLLTALPPLWDPQLLARGSLMRRWLAIMSSATPRESRGNSRKPRGILLRWPQDKAI